MDEPSPREELGSTAPREGNRGEEAPPCRFDLFLALESSEKGGLGIWGLRRGRAQERRAGHGEGEGVGEGERGQFKCCGAPQNG